MRFHYGPDGHLARATRGEHSYEFVYDDAGNRVAKLSGGVFAAAYHGDLYITRGRVIDPVDVAGVLVGVFDNGQFRATMTDPRGTVTVAVDGGTSWATPYGVRSERPALAEALDYVRKGYDRDLELIRMGVRDYDPRLGGFATPDPLFLEDIEACAGSPIECNLYGYARNNPLRYVDPTGTSATDPTCTGSCARIARTFEPQLARFPSPTPRQQEEIDLALAEAREAGYGEEAAELMSRALTIFIPYAGTARSVLKAIESGGAVLRWVRRCRLDRAVQLRRARAQAEQPRAGVHGEGCQASGVRAPGHPPVGGDGDLHAHPRPASRQPL